MKLRIILLFAFVYLITGYSVSLEFISSLKHNIRPSVAFAYLNSNNKLVVFKPIDQLSNLKNKQLYVTFSVYLYQKDTDSPNLKILKLKIYFTNGTVVNKDLTSEISSSDNANVVFKYSGNKTIRYFSPTDNIYTEDTISIYVLGFNVSVFPYLVNLSGNVKKIEINMTIASNDNYTINIIELDFGNNLPLSKKYYKGKVDYIELISSPSPILAKYSLSLPNLSFVKVGTDSLSDLIIVGGNTTTTKFSMNGLIFSPFFSSFVKIGSNIYLMFEPNIKEKGSFTAISGLGFVAFCSNTENSGFYYLSLDYINDLNSIICNPIYLSSTNVNVSFNFIKLDNLVEHNNEKEAPLEIEKFILVAPEFCVTKKWYAVVIAKTLLKNVPYLYFEYKTSSGVVDKSGPLSSGIYAYKNFISEDMSALSDTEKETMLNFLVKNTNENYGYLYSKIIKIKPEKIIKNDKNCIIVFDYNYTLFGAKPSQLSVALININGSTRPELNKSLIVDSIVWLADIKQGLTGIIEGIGQLDQYIYNVKIVPYPTSSEKQPLYVFKFIPSIRVQTNLFVPGGLFVIEIGLFATILTGLVAANTISAISSFIMNEIEYGKQVVSLTATSLYSKLSSQTLEKLLTTGDPDLIGLGFILNPEKTYATIFAPNGKSVLSRGYQLYEYLKSNPTIRQKFFKELQNEMNSNEEFKNLMKKAFGDDFVEDVMSNEFDSAFDKMFVVNNYIKIAKLNVQENNIKIKDLEKIDDIIKKVCSKTSPEFNDEYGDILTKEFSVSNEIAKISSNLEDFNQVFKNVGSEESFIKKVISRRLIPDSLEYLSDGISDAEVASESKGVIKVLHLFFSSEENKEIGNEIKYVLRDLANKLRTSDISSIDELSNDVSFEHIVELIVEKFNLENVEDLKGLFKVLYGWSNTILDSVGKLVTGEISDDSANEIIKKAIKFGNDFGENILEFLRSERINEMNKALQAIKKILSPTFVKGVMAGLFFLNAVSFILSLITTWATYSSMIKFAQQIYSMSINNSSGYMPLVIVNFEGRSLPVPIPINKSLIQPVKFDKINIWYCHLLGTNIKTFGGLYVGNTSSVSTINQYLPPVGLLPDYYSENALKDVAYNTISHAVMVGQGAMAVANIMAFLQVVASSESLSLPLLTVTEEGLSLAGLATFDFIGLVTGPIGIAAALLLAVGLADIQCHSFKFVPYHMFVKLLGVDTFVISKTLLRWKAKRSSISIDPNYTIIQFYMNNTSYEKLLKQICIYGYLGKWNSTNHICFAGALFNNTPYLPYINNNHSFYYGPIPSRVLMDSGDVYVGILSLPMATPEKINGHEYTYSNKELFGLLNAIWKYFQSPDDNLNSFIGWVKGLSNLKKNYGLMALVVANQIHKYKIMAYLIAGACLGAVVQSFGINNNQSIDRKVCEKFIDDCLPPKYKIYYKNLTMIADKGKYAPLLSGNPTSPIATTNNTKIEFSNNISVRAFNSTDYIVYAPLIVLYARMTSKDKISSIELTMETNPTYTIKFPVYKKSIKVYLDVIGQDSKGYFHSVASDLYNDPSSPIPKSKFKLVLIDGYKIPLLNVTIYNISKTSIYNFNFPLQYLYYIGKSNNFKINVTKQIEYLIVGTNQYYGIFKTIFNTKDVLTDQGIPDYWPNESQSAPVIKPRPNFIKVVPTSIGQEVLNILTTGLSYSCPYDNSYISAGAVANCLTSKLPNVVTKEMINKGKFGFSTNVLAYVDRHNNKIVLLAMKGVVGTDTPDYWKKWSKVQPENNFYNMGPIEKSSSPVCIWPIVCHKVYAPPSFALVDKPYEFQGYFEVQVLVPKTELSEMLTYCSSKYKNCKIALIAIPS